MCCNWREAPHLSQPEKAYVQEPRPSSSHKDKKQNLKKDKIIWARYSVHVFGHSVKVSHHTPLLKSSLQLISANTNNHNSKHFSRTYYVPGIVLSTLHTVSPHSAWQGKIKIVKNKQAGRNHAKWLTGKTDHSINFKNSSQNCKNSFLAYVSKWAFSKFLWFKSRAPQTVWQRQETHGSAVSSTTWLGLMWISLLPLSPFSTSLLHFYLHSPIPFCLSTSVDHMSHGFMSKIQGDNTATWSAIRVWNEQQIQWPSPKDFESDMITQ